MKREDIRNLAIIAHVDHGKTTLVDAMLKQTHALKKSDEESAHLVMDSMDLEKERGITIKAKNASLIYKNVKINIVDTPGHADFGGEVERILRMADGVLLLVDAKEGPMPQTKFVLKKALELGLKAIVVINKIDKPDAQIDQTVNHTFDLFVKLSANHNQLDFPIIYCAGIRGLASESAEDLLKKISNPNTVPDIAPLFEAILKYIPAPEIIPDQPFALQVLALAYDNYKGRLGIGKILSGDCKKNQNVLLIKADGNQTAGKITALQIYEGLKQIDVEEATAGDIVAVAGFDEVHIGDTLTDATKPVQLPPVEIEPPTIKMTFGVNTSPFAGREGKFVTSRQLRERLIKELETNVALKVEFPGQTRKIMESKLHESLSGERNPAPKALNQNKNAKPSGARMQGLEQGSDSFLVSGRGELHLAVLIETMRREGFELQVSQPEVIYHEQDGVKLEPYEIAVIDVPSEHQGVMIEELGRRGGELTHMDNNPAGDIHAEYLIPTRGLIGLKNLMLTRTRGTIVLNNLFDSYKPAHEIDLRSNEHGSLIASESGISNAYGLNNAQQRGILFIGPAVEVYEGMVVGKNSVDSDLELNICKTKKLTNMRSSGSDDAIILTPPRPVELDFALEYIGADELVEVTPKSVRIRKRTLSALERKRAKR